MIPWNPIHRYAGMTSHFDSVDEQESRGATLARLDGWGDAPKPTTFERAPLGFVDVRADAAQAADESTQIGFGNSADDGVGQQEVSELEISAAADVTPASDEKVPFYKREISFGRKKGAAETSLESWSIADDEIADDNAEIDSDASIATIEESVELPVELSIEEAPAKEKVPFFKRELSFRRNSDAGESDGEAAEELTVVDSETAPVPFELEADTFEADTFKADKAEPIEFEPIEFEPIETDSAATDSASEPIEVQAGHELPIDELPIDEPATDELSIETQAVDLEAAGFEPVAFESAPPVFGAEDVETAPAAPDADPVVEPEHVAEPDATTELVSAPVAKVPLHKRDLSFGKGKQGTSQKKNRGTRKTGRKIVGLKIGASQLAAAVVQETDGRYELLELARTPLEPGIVLDGEVRDADSLVAALRSFFADQKLPVRDVRIGVASNRIGVRTFEIAGIDDEARFDNAVRFKAHEVLPIAVSDSVLDYRVLDERMSETGEPIRRVLLVVAPRDQVAPYVDVAERAGLKLAGIDLEALGLLRAFVEPGVERLAGGTSTVVVSIGHEASTLLVSGGGACEFTRVFDWGGSTLQEAIAQELQVHPAEAATILRHLSLAGNPRRVEGIDEDARNRAMEAVRLRLTPFARELVSSLQFYQTQPDSLGIGEIMITGGTSQLEGLGEALHQMIGVQVRIGDPLQRLTLHKGAEAGFEQSIGSLAVPIGLAIDDDPMRTVDLTPRDIVSQKRRPNLVPVLLPVAAAIPLAALGFLFSQAHGNVSHKHSQLTTLHSTLAALPEPKGPQVDVGIQSAEAARAGSVAQVLANRTPWDDVFGDFSRLLPANVWLTELRATVPTPLSVPVAAAATAAATPATTATSSAATTAPVAATGVTITGYTHSQPDVALLLSRLVALPTLSNVQLVSSVHAVINKQNVVSFNILANLRGAGGAS